MKKECMKWVAVILVVGLVAATSAMAGETSVKGTVEKTDQGIIISGEDGATYMVQGKDLSDLVGKTIMATGTLAENESGKTLTVLSIEQAQEPIVEQAKEPATEQVKE